MFGKFFKALFSKTEVKIDSTEYQGYSITPILEDSGGVYYTRGKINKEIDGENKEAIFIRADSHSSPAQAEEYSIIKAKQIIDEQGDSIFNQSQI